MSEMQSEAERRVRAMQERQRLLASASMPRQEGPPPQPQEHAFNGGARRDQPFHGQQQYPSQHSQPFSGPAPADGLIPGLQGMIGRLGLDGDSLIILALLWILWNENADKRLLLALVYLLL